MNYQTALKYTRYNSGTHFLDSGGAYGRTWQTPPPEPEPLQIPPDNSEWLHDVSINVTHMLATHFTPEPIHYANMQRVPGFTTDDLANTSWFEHTQLYLESRGYEQLTRDNTFHSENDFDQDFIFEIWQRPHCSVDDWAYADSSEVLIVLYIHTGCDIRGGYSKPLFGNFDLYDYCMPLDWTVQWHIEANSAATDDEAAQVDSWNDSGEFGTGYSSNPTYHLSETIGTDEGTWKDGQFHFKSLPFIATPSQPYWD